MHEIALTVESSCVEDVIDRVIANSPYGILEQRRGEDVVLRIRGEKRELMAAPEFATLAGRGVRSVSEREVPDDWPERRLLDREPLVIDKVSVRPAWAPAVRGLIDVVIDEGDAFGSGRHPTTRACLELLCTLTPNGALVDLGTGSGVLAVAAAKLGWGPVIAVDVRDSAVSAARAAARRAGVSIEVRTLDLLTEPPPFASTICANVPPVVHRAIAAGLGRAPSALIASGFIAAEAEDIRDVYAGLGLRDERTIEAEDWMCCLFTASTSAGAHGDVTAGLRFQHPEARGIRSE